MFVHSERLIGHLFHQVGFASTMAGVLFRVRLEKIATRLAEKITLFLRDLNLFTSLCLARLIVWRNSRRRR